MDRPAVTLPHRLRRVARALRHSPDRLLHPLRRRHALRRLRQLDRRSPILFVCHGNICRSPYAAAAARRILPESIASISSAGFFGPDRPSPATAVDVARRRGVSLGGHRSALLDAEAIAEAALIVVMSAEHAREARARYGAPRERILILGDLDPGAIDTRTIRDPIEQPAAVFEAVYDRIDRCVASLAAAIAPPRGRDARSVAV